MQFASLSILALAMGYFVIKPFFRQLRMVRPVSRVVFRGRDHLAGETPVHRFGQAVPVPVCEGRVSQSYGSAVSLFMRCWRGSPLWLRKSSPYAQMAAVAVLGSRLVSYALYPNGDQRYTAIMYLIIPVALVLAVSMEMAERAGRTTLVSANDSSTTMDGHASESESMPRR